MNNIIKYDTDSNGSSGESWYWCFRDEEINATIIIIIIIMQCIQILLSIFDLERIIHLKPED